MCVVLPTGYRVIMLSSDVILLSNDAINCLAFHVISSQQEMRVRVLSERDESESRVRFCSCSACSSCLLLDAWPISMFISISLSSQCWW